MEKRIAYVEGEDYFPREIRKKYRLGEYEKDGKKYGEIPCEDEKEECK